MLCGERVAVTHWALHGGPFPGDGLQFSVAAVEIAVESPAATDRQQSTWEGHLLCLPYAGPCTNVQQNGVLLYHVSSDLGDGTKLSSQGSLSRSCSSLAALFAASLPYLAALPCSPWDQLSQAKQDLQQVSQMAGAAAKKMSSMASKFLSDLSRPM